MTSSSCVSGLAMRRRKVTMVGTTPVSCSALSVTKAPTMGARSSTMRCFDFFVDFLVSVKSMSSPENTPLSRDRDRFEFGVSNPELEAPTCLKKSSTALFGQPVRSSCKVRSRSREATQRPRLDESALGAISANLSSSVCGVSRRGTSSGRGASDVKENDVSFVRREMSASMLPMCGSRGDTSSVRFCSSGLRKRWRWSSPPCVSTRQMRVVRLGRM
ncbi:hypothetical protein BJV77DRAFT_186440 [Russula vinacea]|nr:hypothetical protein BJV77DRAFT_186440 [Russula vinacea]